jgi:multicomponent Na+:H+ antiporter subunit G
VTARDGVSVALVAVGVAFFLAGSVGLLRFPDVHARLHALTKADNLGLGFVVAGLALHAPGLAAALKLVLVWGLALLASGTASYLVAGVALRARQAGRGGDGDP